MPFSFASFRTVANASGAVEVARDRDRQIGFDSHEGT